MFKKIALVGVLVLVASAPVCYGFGLPSIPGMGSAGAGGGGGADVDGFLAQGAASTKLISSAKLNLAIALSSKEEGDKLAATRDQVKTGLAAKDSKATDLAKQLDQQTDAALQASEADSAAQERLKSLSSAQKENAAKSLFNLGLGVYMQKAQIVTGQNIIKSGAGNMSIAPKLPAVKDAVSDMASNIKTGGEYMAKLPSLFKSAGIVPVLPTDASSQPKDASDQIN